MASSLTCLSALARPRRLRPTARDPGTPPSPRTSAARSPSRAARWSASAAAPATLAVASSPAASSRMILGGPLLRLHADAAVRRVPRLSAQARLAVLGSSSTATFASARAPRSSRAGASCATGTYTFYLSHVVGRAIRPRAATLPRTTTASVPALRPRTAPSSPPSTPRSRTCASAASAGSSSDRDELSCPGTLTKRGGRFDAGRSRPREPLGRRSARVRPEKHRQRR